MPNDTIYLLNSVTYALPLKLVVGGCAVDMTATIAPTKSAIGRSSYPGRLIQTLGGVGCNIARVAHQCGLTTALVSVTGDDLNGDWARQMLEDAGIVS
jgi:sugar/nucleoside kinase (ribokinase family)